MKTVEDYDKHLQDFYAQSFRDYAIKNGVKGATKYANELLEPYIDAINDTLAKELLTNLGLKAATPEDKLDIYPSMYWKGEDGTKLLRDMSVKFTRKELSDLFDKKAIAIEDIKISYEKVTNLALKLAVKKEEQATYLIKSFEDNLVVMLSDKVELNQLDGKEAKQLHDNAVKATFKNEELEKLHKTFPVLASHLGGILHQVKMDDERNERLEARKALKVT